eukprot:m.133144 g.133144  ORF g.133144 m.133144 type:complete len:469 (+) comp38108_c0_seq1:881-2287(+)
MGYTGAKEAKSGAYFGEGSGIVWTDNFQCTGAESSLRDCNSSGWEMHNCNHSQDANVVCIGNIRLIGGLKPDEGRVEVLYNGTWGAVCDADWDIMDAHVACRQLGFSRAAKAAKGAAFGERSEHVSLSNVSCTGNEESLIDCEFNNAWEMSNCSQDNTVGVVCISGIRLVGGSKPLEGRVELLHKEKWITACGDSQTWSMSQAHFACKKMGYIRAQKLERGNIFGRGLGKTRAVISHCTANILDNMFCKVSNWSLETCFNEAGVVCVANIRLAGGSKPGEGRVEVLHKGKWGTVCDDNWDLKDANVACRELGYKIATDYKTKAYFGKGKGPIWMDETSCKGSETSLTECSFAGWGQVNCRHDEDASVVCLKDGSVRFVDGSKASEGQVEVFRNDKWDAICYSSWDSNDARVACRELGYSTGTARNVYSRASVYGWTVRCDGDEIDIEDCQFSLSRAHCGRYLASAVCR